VALDAEQRIEIGGEGDVAEGAANARDRGGGGGGESPLSSSMQRVRALRALPATNARPSARRKAGSSSRRYWARRVSSEPG